MGVDICKKAAVTATFLLLCFTGDAAQARWVNIGGKSLDFKKMESEAPAFLLVCALHATCFFLLWLYTRAKKKPVTKKEINTVTHSIYFNCSHTKAAVYASILFVFCIAIGFSLLILEAPICIYMDPAAHTPFYPLLSIAALVTMPIGCLAGMRSAYICFRYWPVLKASSIDHRYCAGSILLYSMFMYISYRLALPLIEGTFKCATLV